jgi:predicted nucleotidyltransferase
MDQNSAFEIVKEYIKHLKNNKYNVRKAYIFGSYANGKFDDNSDIDLAIVLRNLSNSFTTQIQLMKVSRKFDSRIEPHPIDETDFNSSNPFAYEIITKGIQIE